MITAQEMRSRVELANIRRLPNILNRFLQLIESYADAGCSVLTFKVSSEIQNCLTIQDKLEELGFKILKEEVLWEEPGIVPYTYIKTLTIDWS